MGYAEKRPAYEKYANRFELQSAYTQPSTSLWANTGSGYLFQYASSDLIKPSAFFASGSNLLGEAPPALSVTSGQRYIRSIVRDSYQIKRLYTPDVAVITDFPGELSFAAAMGVVKPSYDQSVVGIHRLIPVLPYDRDTDYSPFIYADDTLKAAILFAPEFIEAHRDLSLSAPPCYLLDSHRKDSLKDEYLPYVTDLTGNGIRKVVYFYDALLWFQKLGFAKGIAPDVKAIFERWQAIQDKDVPLEEHVHFDLIPIRPEGR